MTMECLCRKLFKYGLIEKKDGEWTTDFIDRKTEPPFDKDINVRSKDEPHIVGKHADAIIIDEPQTDGYISGEDFMKIFDEPQTDCAWGKCDD